MDHHTHRIRSPRSVQRRTPVYPRPVGDEVSFGVGPVESETGDVPSWWSTGSLIRYTPLPTLPSVRVWTPDTVVDTPEIQGRRVYGR